MGSSNRDASREGCEGGYLIAGLGPIANLLSVIIGHAFEGL